ncbi:MAG: peptidyl-prolyl cis-trans isomerase, partial [Candidatus Latescibacteria bacterium]|nr:peptidyl-prolyl cis-trans isomerase [Candidatus Latescibacterota bacterium]
MRDYFTQNKLNEEIRISRIAVRSLEDARAVFEEIKKGADFAQLAKRRSLDRKYAKTGGDIGYWSRDAVPEVVAEKVFPVQVAEIVEPLWWGSYYWVHKVTDRRVVSFEERKERVKTILRREWIPKRWKEYTDELKKRYRMAIVDSALVAFLEAKQGRGRTMSEVSGYTLVKFKDGEMSVADYLRWLRDGFPRRGDPAWSDSTQVRDHVELLAIDNELIQREAHRKGIDRRKSLLAELNLLKEKLMAEELRGIEVVNKVQVTEQEAKKYYQEHLGRYRRPGWVRGVEVLVETEKEAKKILELARKSADLGDLAQEYTIREKGRERKGIFRF